MGYLPVSSTFRMRSMHTRGINRCMALGITDLSQIAKMCLIPSVEILEANLTKGQNISLGKAKKAAAKRLLAEAKEDLGADGITD